MLKIRYAIDPQDLLAVIADDDPHFLVEAPAYGDDVSQVNFLLLIIITDLRQGRC